MAESDLDRRLRDAFAHPGEPEALPGELASVRAALPARRARRRLAVGAAGAVASLGVVLGLVVPWTGGPPGQFAVGHSASSAQSCVQLVVGSAAPRCAGTVVSQASVPEELPAAGAFASASPPQTSPPQTGPHIVVSLPRLTGVTWITVTVSAEGAAGASGVQTIRVHADRDGRSTAEIGPLSAGRYQVAATGDRRCSGRHGCLPGVAWSAVVTAT
jgi:hypothetical protein